jgi:hypothetical protein
MHPQVIDAWHTFSTPLEGRVPHMYLDILGLITCGVGNLIDGSQNKANPTPWAPALALPWKRDSDGGLANDYEVRAAWSALKARQDLARRGVSHARALTKLHLDDADIDALVAQKLAENEAFITANYFYNFASFPADAQIAIMSMAWAVGPGFPLKFPRFRAAVEAENWLAARENCTIREEGNPGVVPRNRANRVCFANAAIVVAEHMALDILRWPNVAVADVPPSDRAANHGSLVVEALDDARIHALEVTRLEGLREMREDDEPTKPVNMGKGIA